MSKNFCPSLFITQPQWINPSATEAGIWEENKTNTKAADALAPCITLFKQDKLVFVFHRNTYTCSMQKYERKWEI